MRVVGGKFRGRILKSPSNNFVRPTTDKVKEAVFNILGQNIDGARWLDLFGGAGGMGIEAISRGATAVFVDASRDSFKLIKDNLAHVGAEATVMYADYKVAIQRLAEQQAQFDYIYIDPPYASGFGAKALEAVLPLVAADGKVLVEHRDKEEIDSLLYDKITVKRYGIVCISIFTKKEAL